MPLIVKRLSTMLWHLLRQAFSATFRGLVVVSVILSVAWAAGGDAEKTGDNLQIALPLLAWGCAAANGDGAEYLGRYLVMFGAAHGMKQAFGDAAFNQRPGGGSQGMPSAHTSTAVLGASRLISDCVGNNLIVQAVVTLAAGFVGASRIDAGAHTIWQVLYGAILGLVCDRAFGKNSVARRWLVRWVRQMLKGRVAPTAYPDVSAERPAVVAADPGAGSGKGGSV